MKIRHAASGALVALLMTTATPASAAEPPAFDDTIFYAWYQLPYKVKLLMERAGSDGVEQAGRPTEGFLPVRLSPGGVQLAAADLHHQPNSLWMGKVPAKPGDMTEIATGLVRCAQEKNLAHIGTRRLKSGSPIIGTQRPSG